MDQHLYFVYSSLQFNLTDLHVSTPSDDLSWRATPSTNPHWNTLGEKHDSKRTFIPPQFNWHFYITVRQLSQCRILNVTVHTSRKSTNQRSHITSSMSRDCTKRCHWLQHLPREYFPISLKAWKRAACRNCTRNEINVQLFCASSKNCSFIACNNCTWNHHLTLRCSNRIWALQYISMLLLQRCEVK